MRNKYIILNLILIIAFSCNAQKSTNETESKIPKKIKIAIDTVDKSVKELAYNFAYGTFANCESYEFPELTAENATEYLINFWKKEKNQVIETCNRCNSEYGKLLKLNLSEVLYDKYENKFFRYKAKYSKTENTAEIRIYVNSENKLSGIIIKELWTDKYLEFDKKSKTE